LAGDAEMHRPLRQLVGDFGGRQIGDLDLIEPGDRAAVVARAARLDQREAGAGEERLRVLLQPPLRRHRDDEPGTHGLPQSATRPSPHTANPPAGTTWAAPSRTNSPS